MTLRLDDQDDRALGERARQLRRSKQELAKEAIHAYLADEYTHLEDLEDQLALARHRLRSQLGDVRYHSHAEARRRVGLDPE